MFFGRYALWIDLHSSFGGNRVRCVQAVFLWLGGMPESLAGFPRLAFTVPHLQEPRLPTVKNGLALTLQAAFLTSIFVTRRIPAVDCGSTSALESRADDVRKESQVWFVAQHLVDVPLVNANGQDV